MKSDHRPDEAAVPGLSGAELDGIVAFLRGAERLKGTLRSGHTSTGRRESTADHTWRLCLLAILCEPALDGIDMHRLLKLCVIHDLAEAVSGDVPATEAAAHPDKSQRERADLHALCAPLPDRLRDELTGLWEEYEAAETPEARLAKGLDKLETVLQHAVGRNPADFDYAFNLGYGADRTAAHPLLAALRRRADAATRARMG